MNNATKFVFASALALSSVVPAFAGHGSKMNHLAQQPQVERLRPPDALDARAYAPNIAPIENPYDFGIGNQR
jgi:hypothetical protein